jgi:hypothetical protein
VFWEAVHSQLAKTPVVTPNETNTKKKKRRKNIETEVRSLVQSLNDATQYKQWWFADTCSVRAQKAMNGRTRKKMYANLLIFFNSTLQTRVSNNEVAPINFVVSVRTASEFN